MTLKKLTHKILRVLRDTVNVTAQNNSQLSVTDSFKMATKKQIRYNDTRRQGKERKIYFFLFLTCFVWNVLSHLLLPCLKKKLKIRTVGDGDFTGYESCLPTSSVNAIVPISPTWQMVQKKPFAYLV